MGDLYQIYGLLRNIAKTVDKLVYHIIFVITAPDGGDLLVHLQFGRFVGYICFRYICRCLDINGSLILFIIDDLAFQSAYSFIHHFAVEFIAYIDHVSMLFCPQHIACTTDLKVPHGYLESGSELCKLSDGPQPLFCLFPQDFIFLVHQISISLAIGSSDPAPELI